MMIFDKIEMTIQYSSNDSIMYINATRDCVVQWIKIIHRFLQIFDLLLFCLSVYF